MNVRALLSLQRPKGVLAGLLYCLRLLLVAYFVSPAVPRLRAETVTFQLPLGRFGHQFSLRQWDPNLGEYLSSPLVDPIITHLDEETPGNWIPSAASYTQANGEINLFGNYYLVDETTGETTPPNILGTPTFNRHSFLSTPWFSNGEQSTSFFVTLPEARFGHTFSIFAQGVSYSLSTGPLLMYSTVNASNAAVMASYGFFEGWAATGPSGSYFVVDHTASEQSNTRLAANRDFVNDTPWSGFSGSLPTRLLTVWLAEADAGRTFVLHTPEGSLAWLTAAWVDDTANSGLAGYQVNSAIGVNQTFWLVREIDGVTNYGEMGIENLAVDWSNAFPPYEPPPPPEDPPYEPDWQTVSVQVGENHWGHTIEIHMGDDSIVYPTADWNNQGSQTATDSSGNVYYSYNWVQYVATVDMNLGITSIHDDQGHVDLMDGFNPPPPPSEPEPQQVSVQVGGNHWGHEIRIRLQDNTVIVAAADESSLGSQDAVDAYGTIYYQYWWKHYVATIPAGASYSVEDDQGHTELMDGFDPPYQPFYQTLTIQVGENHWEHPIIITLGDGSTVYPTADWNNIGSENAVANNGVIYYTYQFVTYTATIDVNLGYSIADSEGHTSFMDGFNPPQPPADPQTRSFNISEEHWPHQPKITQADGTVIPLEPNWDTITTHTGTDSNGVVYFTERYATFTATIDINQNYTLSDQDWHQQLFNHMPPPGASPLPLSLKIAASRWNHELQIRSSSGVVATVNADQMQGFWTVDQTSQSWWTSYYFFNATGSYPPAENWWVYDVTTGDTAQVNTHDLSTWASPDANLDTDQDTLVDWYELLIGTNPNNEDSDGDEMFDGWEIVHRFNPRNSEDAQVDTDGDGATNLQEFLADSDPRDSDSDNDGWNDGEELGMGTNPLFADTDEDGDRLPTAFEVANDTDPNDYYNGVLPTLTVIGGTNVTGSPGERLPELVEVLVKNGVVPLVNAPVQLSIAFGDASLAASPDSQTSGGDITVRSDENGVAKVDVRFGTASRDLVGMRGRVATGGQLAEVLNLIPVFSQVSAVRAASEPGLVVIGNSDKTLSTLGFNYAGQLGNGSTGHGSHVPIAVNGLQDMLAVGAGNSFAVALKENGEVWAWGSNLFGELGIENLPSSSVPVRVADLPTGIVSISVGHHHTLALANDGTVWGWGTNWLGELASGGVNQLIPPMKLSGLDRVIGISAGVCHSLVLREDGTVWEWGFAPNGTFTSVPTQVSDLDNVKAVSAGWYHSMALKNDGTVWAWGYNWFGALGNGTTELSVVPQQVDGVSDIAQISGGNEYSLAFSSSGSAWIWGLDATGDGSATTPVPILEAEMGTIAAVVGGGNPLIVADDGTVWSRMENSAGELGSQLDYQSLKATPLLNLSSIIAIAAGGRHSLALRGNGTVAQWGSITVNPLGGPSPLWRSVSMPMDVEGLTSVSQVAAGKSHSLALKDGTVWAWGGNGIGQLGHGGPVDRYTPEMIAGLQDVVSIGAAGNHSVVLDDDGNLWGWGANDHGQLGSNSLGAIVATPTPIDGATDVLTFATGGAHTIAVKYDRTVWTWGADTYGELGDGPFGGQSPVLTPGRVAGLSNVVQVAAGAHHSLALTASGEVWGWGSNYVGQVGDGTNVDSHTPVYLAELTEIVAIAACDDHSFAVKNDGTVWAWGNNWSGEIGTSGLNSVVPIPVEGLPKVKKISAGVSHGLALKEDFTVASWGDSTYGQLGVNVGNQRVAFQPLLGINLRRVTPQVSIAAAGTVTNTDMGEVLYIPVNFTGQSQAPASVELYHNGVLVDVARNAPFLFTLEPSTWGDYSLTAVAIDAFGARSNRFQPKTVRVMPREKPLLTATPSGPNTATLSWSSVAKSGEHYEIDRYAFGDTNWTTISSLPATTASYLDTTLATGDAYFYRVRLHAPVGPLTSNVVSVSTSLNDRDGDGISDEDEAAAGTNPDDVDTDGDGVEDWEELALNTDPKVAPDSDQDGIPDHNDPYPTDERASDDLPIQHYVRFDLSEALAGEPYIGPNREISEVAISDDATQAAFSFHQPTTEGGEVHSVVVRLADLAVIKHDSLPVCKLIVDDGSIRQTMTRSCWAIMSDGSLAVHTTMLTEDLSDDGDPNTPAPEPVLSYLNKFVWKPEQPKPQWPLPDQPRLEKLAAGGATNTATFGEETEPYPPQGPTVSETFVNGVNFPQGNWNLNAQGEWKFTRTEKAFNPLEGGGGVVFGLRSELNDNKLPIDYSAELYWPHNGAFELLFQATPFTRAVANGPAQGGEYYVVGDTGNFVETATGLPTLKKTPTPVPAGTPPIMPFFYTEKRVGGQTGLLDFHRRIPKRHWQRVVPTAIHKVNSQGDVIFEAMILDGVKSGQWRSALLISERESAEFGEGALKEIPISSMTPQGRGFSRGGILAGVDKPGYEADGTTPLPYIRDGQVQYDAQGNPIPASRRAMLQIPIEFITKGRNNSFLTQDATFNGAAAPQIEAHISNCSVTSTGEVSVHINGIVTDATSDLIDTPNKQLKSVSIETSEGTEATINLQNTAVAAAPWKPYKFQGNFSTVVVFKAEQTGQFPIRITTSKNAGGMAASTEASISVMPAPQEGGNPSTLLAVAGRFSKTATGQLQPTIIRFPVTSGDTQILEGGEMRVEIMGHLWRVKRLNLGGGASLYVTDQNGKAVVFNPSKFARTHHQTNPIYGALTVTLRKGGTALGSASLPMVQGLLAAEDISDLISAALTNYHQEPKPVSIGGPRKYFVYTRKKSPSGGDEPLGHKNTFVETEILWRYVGRRQGIARAETRKILADDIHCRTLIVEAAKAASMSFQLKPPFVGNPTYWTNIPPLNGPELKFNVSATEALADAWSVANRDKYKTECQRGAYMVLMRGISQVMGAGRFDRQVGNRPLFLGLYNLLKELQIPNPDGTGAPNEAVTDIASWIPGDHGYILNQGFGEKEKAAGEAGENVIYLGGCFSLSPTEFTRDALFWGMFPGDYERTLQEWLNEVNSWDKGPARIEPARFFWKQSEQLR